MQNVFHWVGLRNLSGVFLQTAPFTALVSFRQRNNTRPRSWSWPPTYPLLITMAASVPHMHGVQTLLPPPTSRQIVPHGAIRARHNVWHLEKMSKHWVVGFLGMPEQKEQKRPTPDIFCNAPACVPFRDFAAILRSALPGISLQPREVWTTGRNPSAPGSRNSRFPKLCPSERAARLPCNGVARCKLQFWASFHVRGRAAQSATIPAGLVDQSPAWGRGRGTVSSFRLCTPASLWPNIALPSGLSFPQTETCEASSVRRAKRTAGMLSGLL